MLFLSILYIFFYNLDNNRDILGFFSDTERSSNYSNHRIGPILTAFGEIYSSDYHKIIFGYGAGSVSASFSNTLKSDTLKKLEFFRPANVYLTKLIWEIGFFGTTLIIIWIIFLIYDTYILSKINNIDGAISLGTFSSLIIFLLSFLYLNTLDNNIFAFIFFFVLGYQVSIHQEE